MPPPYSLPHPPGHQDLTRRLRSGCVLVANLMVLCLAQPLSAEQPPDQQSAPESDQCTPGFSADDQVLFNFVDTRAGVDFSQYAGMPIGTISYRVLPIFNEQDPDENNWLFRAANWLHIDTRERTLKKQMIIHAGETLDPLRLTENERLLRSNDYLVDAMILPARVCSDRIDLLVVVRDIWTLSPSASASRTGGEDESSAGVSEDNLFGTGQSISIGYFQDADRNGRTFSYRNPLIHERWAFGIASADNSDGEELEVSVVRPFYELDSTWSAGASTLYLSLQQDIENNGVLANRYLQTTESHTAFVGWSRGRQQGNISRWQGGFTSTADRFEADPLTTSLPDDETLRYPWLGWDFSQERFATADNINRTHRQEDIQLGFAHRVQIGYAHEDFGSSKNAVIFSLATGYATFLGNSHLVRTQLYGSGQRTSEMVEDAFFGSGLYYYYFINEKNRWFASVSFDGARNVRDDQQLGIGGDNLRGYPDDYQRGNRRWVMSIERRRFTNWHIFNLAYLGVAGYVDVGKVWDTETPNPPNTDTLANVGFGLRISPSKFRLDKIAHIDIAAPLRNADEVDDYQIIVSGRVDF